MWMCYLQIVIYLFIYFILFLFIHPSITCNFYFAIVCRKIYPTRLKSNPVGLSSTYSSTSV